jgi:hypothetical protein
MTAARRRITVAFISLKSSDFSRGVKNEMQKCDLNQNSDRTDELMERSKFVFVLRSGQLGFDTEGKPPRGLEVSGDATEFYP